MGRKQQSAAQQAKSHAKKEAVVAARNKHAAWTQDAHAAALTKQAVAKATSAVMQRVNGASNQTVRQLATAMGLPNQGAVRFPTQDMARTSVAVLTDENSMVSPTIGYGSFNTGDCLVALFGQPGRLAMVWTGNLKSPAAMIIGSIYMSDRSGSPPSTSFVMGVNANKNGTSVVSTPLPALCAQVAAGLQVTPHGATHCVGRQGSNTYIWLNKDDVFNYAFTLSPALALGTLSGVIMRYSGPGEQPTDYRNLSFSIGTGVCTGTWTAPNSGYYQTVIDAVSTDTPPLAALSLTCTEYSITYAALEGWRQVSMADLDPNLSGDINIVEEARVNGCSVLCTNVTSVLNRQGLVLAARVRQAPFWSVTPGMLGRAAEKYQGDAGHGCYTFMEFSDLRQNFVNHNNVKAATFDLDYNDYYHFIQLTNPAYLTQPNSYAIKFDTMLEFKTDIGRYSKASTDLQFMDLVKARHLINSVPEWFYENPSHAAQLYAFIKQALAGAAKYGKKAAPYALKMAAMANPEYAPVFGAMSRFF